MSVDTLTAESLRKYPSSRPQHVDVEDHEHPDSGPTTVLGFWIYLMSDCILFAALFASYSVLGREFGGGPTGKELFKLPYVLTETCLLLFSSFTYGLVMLALYARRRGAVLGWLSVTFALGLCFISMEVNEFARMMGEGAGPDRSAFLSSFFTLVSTHGLHVTAGLIWMAVLMAQVARKAINPTISTRLMCLSLFWHFLDIVWIGVFTVVYLMGSI